MNKRWELHLTRVGSQCRNSVSLINKSSMTHSHTYTWYTFKQKASDNKELELTTPTVLHRKRGWKKERKKKIKDGPLEAQACLSGLTWETFHWRSDLSDKGAHTHIHTQKKTSQQIQNCQRRPVSAHTVRKPLCETCPRTDFGFALRSYLPPLTQTQIKTNVSQWVCRSFIWMASTMLLWGELWVEWFTAVL